MKSTIASLLIAPTLLIATSASATPLVSEEGTPITQESPYVSIEELNPQLVMAEKDAKVLFDRPDINSEPAPEKSKKDKKDKEKKAEKKEKPKQKTVLASQEVAPVQKPAPKPAPAPQPVQEAKPTPAPQPAPQAVQPAPQPKPEPAPQPKPKPQPKPQPVQQAVSSASSSVVSSAALGQIGVIQDCTALVEKALRAAGVSGVGDESPASLLRFGTPTSNPQPGDMIYYANAGAGVPHIAIYAGGGKAVHGGWLGNQTVINKANIGSGPVYYSVN